MTYGEVVWCTKQASKVLKGAKILGIEAHDDGDEGQLNLIVQLADGREAEVGILRDPEGNGPGWLDVGHITT